MKLTEYGVMFDDVYELTYNLLSAIGIEIRMDGSLYDPDIDTVIYFDSKLMKANIYPNNLHYAGQGEIMFEPLINIKQCTELLGYFIEKKRNLDNMNFLSFYPEEMEDDITGWKYTALTIKFKSDHNISTTFYYNKCLKFIEMIFILGEQEVNLLNFDSTEDAPIKDKRIKSIPCVTKPRKRPPIYFE